MLIVDGDLMAEISESIGHSTNNRAEYKALIRGLEEALLFEVTDLSVTSDSELLVKQMSGEYKVKDRILAGLKLEADQLARKFEHVRFEHVLRARNSHADKLANLAIVK